MARQSCGTSNAIAFIKLALLATVLNAANLVAAHAQVWQVAQVEQAAPAAEPGDTPADRIRDYVTILARKVESKLVYPDRGRRAGLQGTATVSFTIKGDGSLSLDTLKIVSSSGQPTLDASALQTIRACDPFDPPPKEMTVAIAVNYSRR